MKNLRNSLLIFTFFLSLMPSAYAEKFYKFTYYVKEGDQFARIIKRFVLLSTSVDATDTMIARTIEKNKSDLKSLEAGQEITMYVLPSKANFPVIKKYILNNLKPSMKAKLDKIKFERDDRLSLYGFYTISEGTLEEELASKIKLNSSQFSPITIGGGAAYKIKNHRGSISTSFYWSKLTSSEVATNQSTQVIDVPSELGATLYYEYLFSNWPLLPYIGFDFESFTTFNLAEVFNTSKLVEAQNNKIWWLTLGLTKYLPTRFGGFLFKASLSKSIAESSDATVPYKGYKFILYANWKPGKKLLYHALYKTHILGGSTDLKVTRIGAGLGWTFK